MNRELGADFDLAAFEHRAIWNAGRTAAWRCTSSSRRVRRPCAIPRARTIEVNFEDGESIWTESSYKYQPQEVVDFVSEAGFAAHSQWMDPDARFALTLFVVE